MTTMTWQEIHDKVFNHLMAQGGPSVFERGGCAYRGVEGRKCAVGVVIADEAYQDAIELRSVHSQLVQQALEGSGVVTDAMTVELLSRWQVAHDRAAAVGDTAGWAVSIRESEARIAGQFGLVSRAKEAV